MLEYWSSSSDYWPSPTDSDSNDIDGDDDEDSETLVGSSTSSRSHASRSQTHTSRGLCHDGVPAAEDRHWPPHKSELKASFLTGTTKQHQLVRNLIEKHYHAIPMRIRFKFVDSWHSFDIRVTFSNSGTSKSYVGTDALKHGSNEATMTHQMNQSELKVQADVLHEFGHVLGLLHEHKHQDFHPRWNLEHIRRNYDYDNEANMRRQYEKTGSVIGEPTAYDLKSIMHYPVEIGDTMSRKTRISLNKVLSDGDRRTLMKLYPIQDAPNPRPIPKPKTVLRPRPIERITTGTEPKKRTPLYISGSGDNTVQEGCVVVNGSENTVIKGGGYVNMSGSEDLLIKGYSEVDVTGSSHVKLIGNGTVRKSGSGNLVVIGDCDVKANGSGTVRVTLEWIVVRRVTLGVAKRLSLGGTRSNSKVEVVP